MIVFVLSCIQNDVYFLRRTLKKSKKGTLSHSFNIYKYDESGEYYDFLGKNAIDLSIKEAQKTRKVFEATIGSYEDYVFSSYYESQNIEKWLETTEKERYRLFCEYLGLGILEEKYQAALELMKNHVKASFISKYSIEGLQGEIQDAKVEISDIVGGINEREAHVKRLNGKIQEFQEKVNLLSKEIKVVDVQKPISKNYLTGEESSHLFVTIDIHFHSIFESMDFDEMVWELCILIKENIIKENMKKEPIKIKLSELKVLIKKNLRRKQV